MSTSTCHVCGRTGKIESVTVRVYLKRLQRDFRYRPCSDCRAVLFTFLESSALATAKGMFDHQHWENRPAPRPRAN